MKKLLMITVLLTMAAACTRMETGTMETAVDDCANNGGLAYVYVDSFEGSFTAHCKNGARFYYKGNIKNEKIHLLDN